MPGKYRHFKDILPNGLRVVTVEAPHLHSIALALYAKVGSRFETPATNGLSHFLEHMVFRGSDRYPTSYALNDAIEQRGGTLQATTSRDCTAFYMKTHPALLGDGVEILGELFRAPRFAQIDVERQIVMEEILEDYDEDDVDICSSDIARTALWPRHPLGLKIIGTRKNVMGFTRDDLERHRREFYAAGNLVFSAVGALTRSDVLAQAERFLGDLPAGPSVEMVAAEDEESEPRVKLVEQDDQQTEVVVSFRALGERDPDYTTLQVLRRVLDDGISSRLQKHVCEDLGLAYDVGASTECWADTGAFDIEVSVEKKKTERIVRELLTVVRALRDDGPTEEELTKVKRRFGWDLEFAKDSVSDLSTWFGATELYTEAKPFEAQFEEAQRVTAADVKRVAARVLKPQRLAVAVLGPMRSAMKKRVREAVADFAR